MEQFAGIPTMLASASESTTDQTTCKAGKVWKHCYFYHLLTFICNNFSYSSSSQTWFSRDSCKISRAGGREDPVWEILSYRHSRFKKLY